MRNQYNKGPYRFYEYGKISPYLKGLGNKKWRKTINSELELSLDELSETSLLKVPKKRRGKKGIIVKITEEGYGGKKWSFVRKYRSMRDAQKAIDRNRVIRVHFIKK